LRREQLDAVLEIRVGPVHSAFWRTAKGAVFCSALTDPGRDFLLPPSMKGAQTSATCAGPQAFFFVAIERTWLSTGNLLARSKSNLGDLVCIDWNKEQTA